MEQSKILNGNACDSEKTIFFNITTRKKKTFCQISHECRKPVFFIYKKFNFCTQNKGCEKKNDW